MSTAREKKKAGKSEDSVDTDNDAYVGVAPEYRNHADVALEPFGDEDDEIVQRQKAFENSVTGVGFQGFNPVVEDSAEDEDSPEDSSEDEDSTGSSDGGSDQIPI